MPQVKGGLFTALSDTQPDSTNFEAEAGLTSVQILDFELARYLKCVVPPTCHTDTRIHAQPGHMLCTHTLSQHRCTLLHVTSATHIQSTPELTLRP